MVSKTVLILVAVFSWLATAAITLTVLTFGPVGQSDENGTRLELVKVEDQADARKPLPRYNLMPVFDLIDQDGNTYGLNDLRGKFWVVDTIFTRCPAICPTLASGLRDVQSTLKNGDWPTDDIRLVSISIDGDHDTPDVLKQYANAYDADPNMWVFLTGEQDVIWPLVQDGLKLPVEPGEPGDEMNILHSGKLVLLDRTGVIRGYYDGLSEAGRIQMLADLRRLVQEP